MAFDTSTARSASAVRTPLAMCSAPSSGIAERAPLATESTWIRTAVGVTGWTTKADLASTRKWVPRARSIDGASSAARPAVLIRLIASRLSIGSVIVGRADEIALPTIRHRAHLVAYRSRTRSTFRLRISRMSKAMSKVRWGVLSTAKIATQKVIPAMQRGQWSEVTAIASRDLEKARTIAATMGIAHAYGSYEALLDDPDIDAIYNPLPNHLHVPWTVKAAER